MWTKVFMYMVAFFIVASPSTFKIVRGLIGSWVASTDGLATPAGLVLHAVVFVSLVGVIPLVLERRSYYEGEEYKTLAERQAELRRKFAHLDPNSRENIKARKAKAQQRKARKATARKARVQKSVRREPVQDEPVVDSTPMGGYLF